MTTTPNLPPLPWIDVQMAKGVPFGYAPKQVEAIQLAAYHAGRDAGPDWQPIETAPQDGTPLLLFARATSATAFIDMFGWYLQGRGWIAQSICGQDIIDIVPSHWMARPPFPGDRL